MTAYKTPVSVLVVIHTVAGEFLLIERAAHPGYWQSVTGSLEATDADLATTARREVVEETGIPPELGTLTDWHLSNRYEIFPEWRHRYAPGVTTNTNICSACACPAGLISALPRTNTGPRSGSPPMMLQRAVFPGAIATPSASFNGIWLTEGDNAPSTPARHFFCTIRRNSHRSTP